MKSRFATQKKFALGGIIALGVSYAVFLSVATAKLWPDISAQFQLLVSAVKVNCTFPELLAVGPGVGTWLLAGVLAYLWSRFVFSGAGIVFTCVKTHLYIQELYIERTQAGINYVRSPLAIAFTAGYLRPRIFLSSSLTTRLTVAELRGVIRHEQHHVHSYDPLLRVVIQFIRGALIPFPFKSNIFSSYEVLVELAADEAAHLEAGDRKNLISALAKIGGLQADLQLAWFGFRYDRIKVLLDEQYFVAKGLFVTIGCVLCVLVANTILVGQFNLLGSCQAALAHIQAAVSQVDSLSSSQSQAWCSFAAQPQAPEMFTPAVYQSEV